MQCLERESGGIGPKLPKASWWTGGYS